MKNIFKTAAFAALAAFVGAQAATTYGPVTIDTVKTTIQHNGVNKDTTLLRAVFDGTSSETLSIPEDVVVSEVVIRRKFEAGKSQTMMLPFSIPRESWRAQPLKFWRFEGMAHHGDGTWQFKTKKYSSDIDANTPFVVQSDYDADSIVFQMNWMDGAQYGNTTLNSSKDGTPEYSYKEWVFKGTYSRIDWEQGHPDLGCVYGFSAKNKDGISVGQFVKAGIKEGSTTHPYILPMRAYLHYVGKKSTVKKAASFVATAEDLTEDDIIAVEDLPQSIEVIFDDTEIDSTGDTTGTLGVGRIDPLTGEITVDHWVDLKGRKLEQKPTTKGTYYNNRKKVIIK